MCGNCPAKNEDDCSLGEITGEFLKMYFKVDVTRTADGLGWSMRATEATKIDL